MSRDDLVSCGDAGDFKNVGFDLVRLGEVWLRLGKMNR